MVFLSMANTVCVRTLATELFPTSLRGTGAGSLALLETVGVGTGLLLYAAAVGRVREPGGRAAARVAGLPRRGREHAARARDGRPRARGGGGHVTARLPAAFSSP